MTIAQKNLTAEQHDVCWNKATEAPFTGKYADCKKEGVYYCVCCNNPLFNSETKYLINSINFCKLKEEFIDYFLDTTKNKVGKYLPGTKIKVKKYKKEEIFSLNS